MGYSDQNDDAMNVIRDYTKPESLNLKDTTDSFVPFASIPRYPSGNPLILNSDRNMAAFDGNRSFSFSGVRRNEKHGAMDATLDDITIPKDLYKNIDCDISKTNGVVQLSGTNTSSNPKSVQSAQNSVVNASGPAPVPAAAGDVSPVNKVGSTSADSSTDDDSIADLYDKADELSGNDSVTVGGKWISRSDYDSPFLYTQAIYQALTDDKAARTARRTVPQQTDNSQDVYRNPGPVPGLSHGLQALVDKSYDLGKNSSVVVGGETIDRSHYNDQDGYRRMILRGLLSEIHGGWRNIPDDEIPLINPYFNPALAAFGRNAERIAKIETNILTGGALGAAEAPEAVKEILDWVGDIFGG